MNKEDKNIGTLIKSYRKDNGMSQEYMAETLDITQPQLSNIESGRMTAKEDLIKYMVESGILPEKTLKTSEEIKLMIDRMNYEDKLLMKDFAKRILR